jgi:hypothetical protein
MSETKIRRIIRKKKLDGVVIKKDKHIINPLVLMKKLPSDINILINSFLYDKNGYNEDLIKYFNRFVLYDGGLINKMNSIYFKELEREMEEEDGGEYKYHIVKTLCNGFFTTFVDINRYASNIIVEFDEFDDGKPEGEFIVKTKDVMMRCVVEDDDELINKYDERDLIERTNVLENINAEILFKYLKDRGGSYYKSCLPTLRQIKSLQHISNTITYEVLKGYVRMGGDNKQFYEWFVNYYAKDAFKVYYEYWDNDYCGIEELDFGWKTTNLVIFH